jgi:hypothetical protein
MYILIRLKCDFSDVSYSLGLAVIDIFVASLRTCLVWPKGKLLSYNMIYPDIEYRRNELLYSFCFCSQCVSIIEKKSPIITSQMSLHDD